MLPRRELLKQAAAVGAGIALPSLACAAGGEGVEVNDMQSQLNATRVSRIVEPKSLDELQAVLRAAAKDRTSLAIAGGRHAMGGQQFASDATLLDTRSFNQVVAFDKEQGRIEVQSGILWPDLIDYLIRQQAGDAKPWAIREKQTGVDRVSLGGSLAANVHGRGLRHPPIISDVESLVLLDADGKAHTCSRRENAELFSLAIGGYGLFGIIAHVTLRLVPRTKVQRVVEVIRIADLLAGVDQRIEEGFVYGDCQYSTHLEDKPEDHLGVFSCYKPVAADTPITEDQKQLSADDWAELYTLARTDKKRAFERYSKYYLGTSGQVYWSESHQLSGNFDGYRRKVDPKRGTEVITEVYVTREAFLPFMAAARQDFIDHDVDMTYGTIRFIERDTESFLAWAREPSVCIICNLHVRHTDEGKRKAQQDFQRIIDRAIEHKGRYYLTYHRWARRDQVEACYPNFVEFLKLKAKYDPHQRFQSDWHRHYRQMFADVLS